MSDPDINELDALRALVESDGWEVFLRAVDSAHGDAASVQQIDQQLGVLDRGDALAVQDTVQQIRARARAVQAMVRWPHERIALLRKKEKPGMFAGMRRA